CYETTKKKKRARRAKATFEKIARTRKPGEDLPGQQPKPIPPGTTAQERNFFYRLCASNAGRMVGSEEPTTDQEIQVYWLDRNPSCARGGRAVVANKYSTLIFRTLL